MSTDWATGFLVGMLCYALVDAFIFPRIAGWIAQHNERRRRSLPVRVERRFPGGR